MTDRSRGQAVFEVIGGALMVGMSVLLMLFPGLPGLVAAFAVLFNVEKMVGGIPWEYRAGLFFGGLGAFIGAVLLFRHGVRVMAGESKR